MKIISKSLFEILNGIHSKKMFKDKKFQKKAINLLVEADKKFRWIHQSN